jgi:nucleoside-diphosphate-sugar epimerase
MAKTILVTGITGFIGLHCARELLEHGYHVRGTLRDASRSEKTRKTLEKAVPGCSSSLSFIEADLQDDKGWAEAVTACDGIFHVASPFPAKQPRNENDLIIPAREGTLRVLRAAAKLGVHRVVLTSSMVAVFQGNHDLDRPLTGDDWSRLDRPGMNAYAKSKTLAEKAAWDFVNGPSGRGINLTALNPGLVLGPALNEDFGTSLDLIKQMMTGEIPASPPISIAVIDVRDVAAAHRLAFEKPASIGKRFLLPEFCLRFKHLATIVKKHYPNHKAPTNELPPWLVRLMSNIKPELKGILSELGNDMRVDNSPAQEILGLEYHSLDDMVVASVESLFAAGALKRK